MRLTGKDGIDVIVIKLGEIGTTKVALEIFMMNLYLSEISS